MQPIKLIVPGKYWDSHVYAGRLYLFSIDGSIRVINWDQLIEEYPIEDELRVAMTCAFSRSDYLYGAHWRPFFDDTEITEVIRRKFFRLCNHALEVPTKVILNDALVAETENRFPFPHTDSRIYNRAIYVSSQQGVWEAPCHKRLAHGVGQRPQKRWDAAVLGLAVYGSALAMAGGSEGLYETPVGETSWYYGDEKRTKNWDVRKIADRDCVNCDWAFTSVFASSHVESGFLVQFRVEDADDRPDHLSNEDLYERLVTGKQEQRKRTLEGIRKASDIFRHKGYSWAYRDKIYQASSDGIRVRRFRPWAEDEDDVIQSLGEIKLQPWKGRIVSAGVAVFGNIVECENAIVVLASDGEIHTIPGEPVRWRVFPRSKHYENQLHAIYNDRLEVWSFNHDYFVDQDEKKLGVKPYLGRHQW